MIIVYTSETGHTKQYAKILSDATNLPYYTLNEVPEQHKGSDVIYLGWLFANSIKGLENARRKYNVRAVIASGMSPDTPELETLLKAKAKLPGSVPFFYVQGGYDYNKLKGLNHFLMSIQNKRILKRYDDKSEEEKQSDTVYKMFTEGYSAVSEENLKPAIEWTKSQLGK